jgi:hypothetical protein
VKKCVVAVFLPDLRVYSTPPFQISPTILGKADEAQVVGYEVHWGQSSSQRIALDSKIVEASTAQTSYDYRPGYVGNRKIYLGERLEVPPTASFLLVIALRAAPSENLLHVSHTFNELASFIPPTYPGNLRVGDESRILRIEISHLPALGSGNVTLSVKFQILEDIADPILGQYLTISPSIFTWSSSDTTKVREFILISTRASNYTLSYEVLTGDELGYVAPPPSEIQIWPDLTTELKAQWVSPPAPSLVSIHLAPLGDRLIAQFDSPTDMGEYRGFSDNGMCIRMLKIPKEYYDVDPIPCPPLLGRFACNEVIESIIVLDGKQYSNIVNALTCTFSKEDQLHIHLSQNEKVLPGAMIQFRIDALRLKCPRKITLQRGRERPIKVDNTVYCVGKQNVVSTPPFEVETLNVPLFPEVTLQTRTVHRPQPNEDSEEYECALGQSIDVVETDGSLGHDLTVQWSVTPIAGQITTGLLQLINTANEKGTSRNLFIPWKELRNGPSEGFEVSGIVSNVLGKRTMSNSIVLRSPIDDIDGDHRIYLQILGEKSRTMTSGESAVFEVETIIIWNEGEVLSSCAQLQGPKAFSAMNFAGRNFGFRWFLNGKEITKTAQTPAVVIEGGNLAPNVKNRLEVFLEIEGAGVKSQREAVDIFYKQSSLVPKISGGDRMTLSATGKITLDASQSYDPDPFPGNLTYSWKCWQLDPYLPCDVPEDTLFNLAKYEVLMWRFLPSGARFHSGYPWFLFEVTVRKDYHEAFSHDGGLAISDNLLPVWQNSKVATATMIVRFVDMKQSKFAVLKSPFTTTSPEVSEGEYRLNPQKIIILEAASGPSPVSYGWSIASGDLRITSEGYSNVRPHGFPQIFSSTASQSLAIAARSFTGGSSYTFLLHGHFNEDEKSDSLTTIKMNNPPTLGFMTIEPPVGISMRTHFAANFHNWVDDPTDLPLSYSASLKRSASRELTSGSMNETVFFDIFEYQSSPLALSIFSTSSVVSSIVLPPCKKCTLVGLVSDRFGAIAEVDSSNTVQVKAPMNFQLNELEAWISNLLQKYELGIISFRSDLSIFASISEHLNNFECGSQENACEDLNRYECTHEGQVCGPCLKGYDDGTRISVVQGGFTRCEKTVDVIISKQDLSPNCKNGVLNLDNETDIDCGGTCEPCLPRQQCVVDSDCIANFICANWLNKTQCVPIQKQCPNQCNGNGDCRILTDAGNILNPVIHANEELAHGFCTLDSPFCEAVCFCHDGFHGAACSVENEQWASRLKIRKLITKALSFQLSTWAHSLLTRDGFAQWWLDSILHHVVSVSKIPSEIDLELYLLLHDLLDQILDHLLSPALMPVEREAVKSLNTVVGNLAETPFNIEMKQHSTAPILLLNRIADAVTAGMPSTSVPVSLRSPLFHQKTLKGQKSVISQEFRITQYQTLTDILKLGESIQGVTIEYGYVLDSQPSTSSFTLPISAMSNYSISQFFHQSCIEWDKVVFKNRSDNFTIKSHVMKCSISVIPAADSLKDLGTAIALDSKEEEVTTYFKYKLYHLTPLPIVSKYISINSTCLAGRVYEQSVQCPDFGEVTHLCSETTYDPYFPTYHPLEGTETIRYTMSVPCPRLVTYTGCRNFDAQEQEWKRDCHVVNYTVDYTVCVCSSLASRNDDGTGSLAVEFLPKFEYRDGSPQLVWFEPTDPWPLVAWAPFPLLVWPYAVMLSLLVLLHRGRARLKAMDRLDGYRNQYEKEVHAVVKQFLPPEAFTCLNSEAKDARFGGGFLQQHWESWTNVPQRREQKLKEIIAILKEERRRLVNEQNQTKITYFEKLEAERTNLQAIADEKRRKEEVEKARHRKLRVEELISYLPRVYLDPFIFVMKRAFFNFHLYLNLVYVVNPFFARTERLTVVIFEILQLGGMIIIFLDHLYDHADCTEHFEEGMCLTETFPQLFTEEGTVLHSADVMGDSVDTTFTPSILKACRWNPDLTPPCNTAPIDFNFEVSVLCGCIAGAVVSPLSNLIWWMLKKVSVLNTKHNKLKVVKSKHGASSEGARIDPVTKKVINTGALSHKVEETVSDMLIEADLVDEDVAKLLPILTREVYRCFILRRKWKSTLEDLFDPTKKGGGKIILKTFMEHLRYKYMSFPLRFLYKLNTVLDITFKTYPVISVSFSFVLKVPSTFFFTGESCVMHTNYSREAKTCIYFPHFVCSRNYL